MSKRRKLGGAIVATAVVAAVATAVAASSGPSAASFTNVPSANPRVAGLAPANGLSPELTEAIVAQGSMALDGATRDPALAGAHAAGRHDPGP